MWKNIRLSIPTTIAWVLSLVVLLEGTIGRAVNSETAWHQVRSNQAATLFEEQKGTGIKTLKMVLRIEAPLANVLCVLKSPSLNPRWFPRSKEAEIVKRLSSTTVLVHFKSDFPWPFQDRDSVMVFEQSRRNGQVTIKMESRPDALPTVEGYHRVQEATGEWRLRPISTEVTELEYINGFDPGLSAPVFMVNRSLRKHTWLTGLGLKRFTETHEDACETDS